MRRTFIAIMAFSLMLVTALPAAAAPNRAPAPGSDTIAEIVVAASESDPAEFTLLLAALEYTGLTGVFTGGGQYTVFAPTDEAFGNLVTALAENPEWNSELAKENPFAAVDELLGEGTVSDVLLYHVTNGRRAANSVVPPVRDRSINTLLGESFSVSKTGVITDVAGQKATIEPANISASNGVIHVIDTVLLPL